MKKTPIWICVALVISLLLSGCGVNTPAPAPTVSNDLLAKILARGTIVIATDPAYPPQSELIPDAKRAANTKCEANEHTADEFRGFDVATAVEIARRLGVEPCFVTPQWGQIIVGGWDGRWDINVGSMAVTPERLEVLYFSQPYYESPAAFFVHKDNTTLTGITDLSGKRVGVCVGCTYDAYLQGALVIPGQEIDFVVKDTQAFGYSVDGPALDDLAAGDGVKLDAVLTSQQTGVTAIANGMPLKPLGEPVFFEYLAVAMDKKGNLSSLSLAQKITEIVREMHQDKTLLNLSQQYFGGDYVTVAGQIDVRSFGQLP